MIYQSKFEMKNQILILHTTIGICVFEIPIDIQIRIELYIIIITYIIYY